MSKHSSKVNTVLVVDDDPDILGLLKIVLKTAGYRVVTATNGREALQAAVRRPPDLIVLDLMMPVMDGAEFAQTFRAEHDCTPPIIILSAKLDIKKQAYDLGAVGFLAKPFAVDDLLDQIAKQIGKP